MVQVYGRGESAKKLSTNFGVGEFACKCNCCSQVLVDDVLVERLQQIRDHFGTAVNINSGYRCEAHNAKVGGSKTSHHMKGMAADIRVVGVKPAEVAKYAESVGIRRIGLYEGNTEGNFVHIGSGTTKRFWKGHAGINVETFLDTVRTITVELPVLKRGMKGNAVKALQAQLIGYGYPCGSSGTDGSFGSATEAAVKAYQKDHGLEEDGSVGRLTRSTMLGIA